MMREAEAHADEDKKRREDIEARNKADQSVYTAERMLRDTGDKISAAERGAIESAIADLKKAIESNDAAAMNRSMDALTAAQHKAAEALYASSNKVAAPRLARAPMPAVVGERPKAKPRTRAAT